MPAHIPAPMLVLNGFQRCLLHAPVAFFTSIVLLQSPVDASQTRIVAPQTPVFVTKTPVVASQTQVEAPKRRWLPNKRPLL
ncbi:MAG: hypothetical protein ABIU77_05070 [Ferruginibacter sp.]